MCTFQKNIRNRETDCYFSKIDYSINKTLLDEQGLCIFHSKNEVWKTENNFIIHLEELINYFEEESSQKTIFLEYIIFTLSTEELFSHRKFKKNISFNNSQFNQTFTVTSSTFKNINFDSVIFNENVFFIDLSVSRITFDNAYFKSKLSIDKCDFRNDFYMLNTHFNGGVSILNSVFYSNSFFQKMKTNIDKSFKEGVIFKKNHFKGFTTFEFTEFNSVADFKQITIEARLIFHETQFNYNEPLPIMYSVNFEQMNVTEKGRLEFKGSPSNKMFNKVQDVSFLKEEIIGKLFFENIDLTKFSLLSRERLIKAAKMENANVIFGVGCEKYYNRTPLKSIEIVNDNQNLVVELCNTFIDYFTKNGGFNLGVEFVSKTDHNINFFYFSDEIISYEKFEDQLQKEEQNMWRLIKIESDNLKSKLPKNNFPSKIVNVTDTIVNLMSLILKIGSRIPLGLISKEEISLLLNTTIPTNDQSNNGLIVNQIVLFGVKNSQSLQVKKLE